jgi:hypothetical protein
MCGGQNRVTKFDKLAIGIRKSEMTWICALIDKRPMPELESDQLKDLEIVIFPA